MLLNLAVALEQTGAPKEALQMAAESLKLGGALPAAALFHQGVTALAAGPAGALEAEDAFRKCLLQRPRSLDALNGLGLALFLGNKLDEALKAFEQVAAEHTLGNVNGGAALQRLGRHRDALDRYRRLLDAEDARPEEVSAVWCNLGVAMMQAGQHELAAVALRKALQLHGGNGDAMCNQGLLDVMQDRPADAVLALTGCLALDGNRADARNALGVALQQLGRLADALEQLEVACRLRPASVRYQRNLAQCLVRLGRHAEAEALYHRMIEARRLLAAAPNVVEAGRLNGDDVVGGRRKKRSKVDVPVPAAGDGEDPGKSPLVADGGDDATLQGAQGSAIDISGELGLCALFADWNKGADAVAWGRRALALQPKNVEALAALAAALALANEHTEAATLFRECLQLEPLHRAALHGLVSS